MRWITVQQSNVIGITAGTGAARYSLAPINAREVPMCKNTSFAIAAVILGLAIWWTNSSATKADKFGLTNHAVTSNPYLPIRPLEPVW